MFSKVALDVFDQIMLPNWKKSASYAIAPRPWLKSFTTAAKENNIIPVQLAAKLAVTPSMLRLMINSFDDNHEFPSVKLFAINIVFEMSQPAFAIEVSDVPELWRLKSFASSLRKLWLQTIQNNFVLNSKFNALFNELPNSFECTQLVSTGLLAELLCNRYKLSQAYFADFSVSSSNTNISIWLTSTHPSHLPLNDKVQIPVVLDDNNGLELGFFREGFDYSIEIDNQQFWLTQTSINISQALESADFNGIKLGKSTKNIRWSKTITNNIKAA